MLSKSLTTLHTEDVKRRPQQQRQSITLAQRIGHRKRKMSKQESQTHQLGRDGVTRGVDD
jgi:hypothetical protein